MNHIYVTAPWLYYSHAQKHVSMPFVLTCHHPFLTTQHAPEARQAITYSLDNRPDMMSTSQTNIVVQYHVSVAQLLHARNVCTTQPCYVCQMLCIHIPGLNDGIT